MIGDPESGDSLREFQEHSMRPHLTRNQKIAKHFRKSQEAMQRHFYLDTITDECGQTVIRFKPGYARGTQLSAATFGRGLISLL